VNYSKFLVVALLLTIVAFSACISQERPNDSNESIEQEDISGDSESIEPNEQTPNPVVDNQESLTQKLPESFTCNDTLIFSELEKLFDGEFYIGKLAGLGGARGIFTCNILLDNQPIIQMEIRQQNDFFDTLTFVEAQDELYLTQVKDFEKSPADITENSFSYFSPSTMELRILFIDADRTKSVVVKLKTLGDYHFEKDKLFEVARAMEKII